MAIKHKTTKAPGEKLFAVADWNEEHEGTAAPEKHELNGECHEGNLSSSQMPEGGNWVLRENLYVNQEGEGALFTINPELNCVGINSVGSYADLHIGQGERPVILRLEGYYNHTSSIKIRIGRRSEPEVFNINYDDHNERLSINSQRNQNIISMSNETGNVAIGEAETPNKLGVRGRVSIGYEYLDKEAPEDGLIVKGKVGIGTWTPNSTLSVIGSLSTSATIINESTELNETHSIVLCDASAGDIEVVLPRADLSVGRELVIKKIDGSNNSVIVEAGPGDTIDGGGDYTLPSQWDYVRLAAVSGLWCVVGEKKTDIGE
jgi:hypothetical protein